MLNPAKNNWIFLGSYIENLECMGLGMADLAWRNEKKLWLTVDNLQFRGLLYWGTMQKCAKSCHLSDTNWLSGWNWNEKSFWCTKDQERATCWSVRATAYCCYVLTSGKNRIINTEEKFDLFEFPSLIICYFAVKLNFYYTY